MSEIVENTNITDLNKVLKSIKSLKLLTEKKFNSEDMATLAELLNGALPQTEMDKGQARLVRFLANKLTPKGVAELFNRAGCPGLILWTDSKTIISRLPLTKLVYLQWNNENQKYIVEEYTPRAAPLQSSRLEQP